MAVIGKGLAAMGVIEALIKREIDAEILWIGPRIEDLGWANCSRNSTAVVALQGIKEDISPLGDDLVEAFHKTKEFIKVNNPSGVKRADRYHLSPDDTEKLKVRFGSLESHKILNLDFEGVYEEAFIFDPTVFLRWWYDRLEKHPHVKLVDDFIVELTASEARGLKEDYSFDFVFDARGAFVTDQLETIEKIQKVPGHYWVWEDVLDVGLNEFTVLTLFGHNLIYHHDTKRLVLGGSTEKDDISAPRLDQLHQQRAAFVSLFPNLDDVLCLKKAALFSGVRSKASKRRPTLFFQNENHLIINGFYKNGYTLCHLIGERAVERYKSTLFKTDSN